jgi:hypothetical protein
MKPIYNQILFNYQRLDSNINNQVNIKYFCEIHIIH